MNVSYVLQSTTNLNRSSWANLGTILATNTVMNVSMPTGGAAAKLYRVAISPQ